MAGLTSKAHRGHILLAGDPLWLWPPQPRRQEEGRAPRLQCASVRENRLRHLFKSFLPSLSGKQAGQSSCATEQSGHAPHTKDHPRTPTLKYVLFSTEAPSEGSRQGSPGALREPTDIAMVDTGSRVALGPQTSAGRKSLLNTGNSQWVERQHLQGKGITGLGPPCRGISQPIRCPGHRTQ